MKVFIRIPTNCCPPYESVPHQARSVKQKPRVSFICGGPGSKTRCQILKRGRKAARDKKGVPLRKKGVPLREINRCSLLCGCREYRQSRELRTMTSVDASSFNIGFPRKKKKVVKIVFSPKGSRLEVPPLNYT